MIMSQDTCLIQRTSTYEDGRKVVTGLYYLELSASLRSSVEMFFVLQKYLAVRKA